MTNELDLDAPSGAKPASFSSAGTAKAVPYPKILSGAANQCPFAAGVVFPMITVTRTGVG